MPNNKNNPTPPGQEYLNKKLTPLNQHPNVPTADPNQRVEYREGQKGQVIGPINKRDKQGK